MQGKYIFVNYSSELKVGSYLYVCVKRTYTLNELLDNHCVCSYPVMADIFQLAF